MTNDTIDFIEKQAKIMYGWPPNSPDLLPIEIIWSIMKYELERKEMGNASTEDAYAHFQSIYKSSN